MGELEYLLLAVIVLLSGCATFKYEAPCGVCGRNRPGQYLFNNHGVAECVECNVGNQGGPMRKNFEQFLQFIFQIKQGKKVIIITPDYVVMSKNVFQEITEPKEYTEIHFEEEV